jgi:CBS domain-containing protein
VSGSRAEAESSVLTTVLAGLHVSEAMTPDPMTVPGWVTLDRLWDEGVYRRRLSSFPVVDRNGAFAGLVTVPAIRQVPAAHWDQTTAATVARPPVECVTAAPGDDLAAVAWAMSASPDRRAVVLEAGRIVGILSPGDIQRAAAHTEARRTPVTSRL